MDNKVQCMIRLDDITPDMNWEKFYRAKSIFDQYHICPLLGVVPDNQDATLHKEEGRADFWGIIHGLQDDGWKIAQHGTFHCYETEDSGLLGINPFSEFAGLSYEKQIEKLQNGKKILETNGITTDIFMAPGHTYDKITLKALKKCGFKVITDGLYPKPYYMDGLLCIPCRLREFKKPSGIDTVCLHTNLMSDQDMNDLEAYCRNNLDVIVSFEPEEMAEYAVKYSFFVNLWERTVLKKRVFKDKIANSKRLAWYMERTKHSSGKIKWLKRLVCLPLLLFYKDEK